MKVAILTGSVRSGRQSHKIAHHLERKLRERGAEADLIDLAETPLPILDDRSGRPPQLQAAVQGEGGDVFELDMGAPVKIVDLAEDFIRLSGLRPGKDVKIQFTGVRPGEKLFEELYLNSETVVPTSHPKVFRLKNSEPGVPDPAVRLCLDRLGPVDPLVDRQE